MGTAAETTHEVILRDEQVAAVKWMRAREESIPTGGILADDVGKGKTYVASGLIRDAPLWPTLVVVPKATVWEWISVLNKVTGEHPCVITRTDHATCSKFARLVVATHAAFSSRDVRPELRDRKWGRVVVDEAHVIRNPDTLAHKALASLKAHAKWALTATPLQNGGADLLGLARFIGVVTDNADMVRADFLFRRTNTIEGSPALDVRSVRIPLSLPGERELYDQVFATFVSSSADPIVGASRTQVLEHMLRCRQVATHPAIYHRSMAERKAMPACGQVGSIRHAMLAAAATGAPSSKLNHLYADIDSHDENSLVFCDWIDEMAVISEFFESRNIECLRYDGRLSVLEREEVLFLFRNPDGPRVLLIQMQCGACGLNLQIATRVYIMRPQWNPAVEYQAIGRAHRSGQTRRVVVMRLLAEDTVDDVMALRQMDKLKSITGIMKDDAMMRMLCGREQPDLPPSH
jgi:SNF2 family DNA or RNA helicase